MSPHPTPPGAPDRQERTPPGASGPQERTPPGARRQKPGERWKPGERSLIALAAVAAWSIVPPYLGPLVGLGLDVPASVEIVDHVLPGLAAIAGAFIVLADVRRGEPDSLRSLAALGVCALAGLFQTVSHAALVLNAGGPLQPVGAVVLHSSPGPVLLTLSLWLLLRPPTSERVG